MWYKILHSCIFKMSNNHPLCDSVGTCKFVCAFYCIFAYIDYANRSFVPNMFKVQSALTCTYACASPCFFNIFKTPGATNTAKCKVQTFVYCNITK